MDLMIKRRRLLEAGVVVLLASACLVFPCNINKEQHYHYFSDQIPVAIFNFGDSNSDTGSYAAAFGSLSPPYGETTHFGQPPLRFSDGRLLIDLIAERLNLPYLRAYLDSIGQDDFGHGANFATAGSTIRRLNVQQFSAGWNPISLDIQVTQFEQFKARIQSNGQGESARIAKALFTIDHGQNDLTSVLTLGTEEEVIASIPNIIKDFSTAFERLYELGARGFWIHNTGPSGCLPWLLNRTTPEPNNVDPIGCIKSYNEVAIEFNKQLKERISELRDQFEYATIFYIDMYSIKYSLISQGKHIGFRDPLECCCRTNAEQFGRVTCGEKKLIDGRVVYEYCSNPSEYISWDSIHYTEAANKWIVDRVFNGSLSEPELLPWLDYKAVAKNP